ncbi:MAG: HEAT repeat domain-containing protein [Pseudohongiella sp.]|nr:HEAT repeat domain-containing protein [Pseudohongiella sp.]
MTANNAWPAFLALNPMEEPILAPLNIMVLALLIVTLVLALFAIGLRLRNSRHTLLWQSLHAIWDRDILAVLSEDLDPAHLNRLVEPGQELNFLRYLALYAYRLRGSDLERLSTLAHPYLSHAARQLEDSDPEVRAWAVNILNLFGMPNQKHTLLAALQDSSPTVAMFAANALLAHKLTDHLGSVMDQLHRFEKWNLNSLASLLASSGIHAIPIMERIFLDPTRQTRTRVVAADVLNRLNYYAVADSAALLLQQETDTTMQIAILRLLSGVGRERHRAAVREQCASTSDSVRVNAMRTLRHLGNRDDCELFRQAITDSNPWVARQAAWALKSLGDTSSLQALALQQHPRAVMARQVLAEIG